MPKRRILFVCHGNICRSPTAEAVFLARAHRQGQAPFFEVDSAGVSGIHAGESADPRSRKVAADHGYEIRSTARAVTPTDFDRFDQIFAMDDDNLRALLDMAPNAAKSKISRLRDLDPEGPGDVPDPYYGGHTGFLEVIEISERCIDVLLGQSGETSSRSAPPRTDDGDR